MNSAQATSLFLTPGKEERDCDKSLPTSEGIVILAMKTTTNSSVLWLLPRPIGIARLD